MEGGERTSDYYRTQNLPERFDNPNNQIPSQQKCYLPGNPVFSCLNAPAVETPDSQSLIKGYSKKNVSPLFKTTNMEYGSKMPNVHTMPTVYRTKSSAFTEHLGKTGMYRDQGFNTATTKSKV